MRIAITGATGFLGRYLVRRLAAAGHQLRCWYHPSSDRGGLDDVSAAIEWLPGDLANPAAVEFVRGTDAVVHAAVSWEGSGARRRGGPGELLRFLENNLMGSLRLFQAARTAGVSRFVFIATCAVHEVILEDRPLDESHPLWPTSHYGAQSRPGKIRSQLRPGRRLADLLAPTDRHLRPRSSRFQEPLLRRGRPSPPWGTESDGSRRQGSPRRRRGQGRGAAPGAEASAIAGQAFNCYDIYIAEQHVARIAKELTGSSSSIADLNRGPKHQIETAKLRGLGMTFGGEALLRQTVAELVEAHREAPGR